MLYSVSKTIRKKNVFSARLKQRNSHLFTNVFRQRVPRLWMVDLRYMFY